MARPYLPSCTTSARAALPDHELPSVFCQSLSATSGSGTQARARPNASLISTRVTASKVRQPASATARLNGAYCARAAAVLDLRKLRGFMGSLLWEDDGGAGRVGKALGRGGDCPIPRPARDGRA